ncbi:serine hydrolase domain-containing protein [Kordiimonas lipolytica]|uniref:Serine hydrolase domain-containing protein n=1 Tax=Kordiimonas lipolytica TaxID=1662421 RepID=A0ABV8UDZ3_9PROT|nr:serine hydrolase domain-containing protein [Kordiimonas lipolytica]
MNKLRLIALLFVAWSVMPTEAADMPTAAPEDVGLSATVLDDMTRHFDAYVREGKLTGLTTLVARHGKVVHFKAYGDRKLASDVALGKNDIFRIYSMTKPVTGVALMMLYEEGRFSLDDPVGAYLPEFAGARVFKSEREDGTVETVPAKREITIRDLMRHTAGLTYGLFADTPVDKLYQKNGVLESGLSAKEWISRLARQPLLYQPGDKWVYSFAVDVQGRLIEVLSGQPLDQYFEERIFAPLGMKDTGFYITDRQAERLVDMVKPDKDKGLTVIVDPYFPDYTKKPSSFSGGGGLVSTTVDYWRFAQMLANGGELDGVRILKGETIRLMATDQLPAPAAASWGGDRGLGFGLDFAVVKNVQKYGGYGSEGLYYWSGMANTNFWVDPKEDLVVVMMTNLQPYGALPLKEDLHKYVYEALGQTGGANAAQAR